MRVAVGQSRKGAGVTVVELLHAVVVAVGGVEFKRHVGDAEHHAVLLVLKEVCARLEAVHVKVRGFDVEDRSGNHAQVAARAARVILNLIFSSLTGHARLF